jgi:DUF4097 and DUF4098 domain-containing protein YvlB
MSKENSERLFQVSQPVKLKVSNIRGSIEVCCGEDGLIQVTAIKHTLTGDEKRTEIEIIQETDGTVQVATRFPNGGLDWLFAQRPCKVDYIIKVPRACTLKVKSVNSGLLVDGLDGNISVNSVSGDVTLKNLSGSLQVKTISGNVQLRDLAGTLAVNSVSGDVKGWHLSGAIKLDTASGDVALKESDLPSVQARTTSGEMHIATSLGEGPYSFNTISGNVRLVVPVETRCSAEIRSISGQITTRLPQSSNSRQHGTQLVDVQGGGVKVFLKSISGELSLAS